MIFKSTSFPPYYFLSHVRPQFTIEYSFSKLLASSFSPHSGSRKKMQWLISLSPVQAFFPPFPALHRKKKLLNEAF